MTAERATTCCVTGHRILPKRFNKKALEKLFSDIYEKGYRTFLVGMALGFDSECFRALEKLRARSPLSIIACVPCPDQDKRFSLKDRREYRRMLKAADQVNLISEHYFDGCMLLRNRVMVDASSLVVSYLTASSGGTYYTTKYAIDNGVEVIYYKEL